MSKEKNWSKKREIAHLAGERITNAALARGLSVNKFLEEAGVDKSVVDRLKAGTMPAADTLSAISVALGVPTEYLLGTGVFEKWDSILRHKSAVLLSISSILRQLSNDILSGVDDFTFARLVGLFSVSVDEDPDGLGVFVSSPIPTIGTTGPSDPETEKAPVPEISENRRKMLNYFDALEDGDQCEAIGFVRCLINEAAKKDRQTSGPDAAMKAV